MTKGTFTATSFGYGHGPAPQDAIVFDVRKWFRDPHIEPRLRQLTGKHPDVVFKMLDTDGVPEFLRGLRDAFAAVLATGVDVHVAFGCVGGRHRSVVLADVLATWLEMEGFATYVEHRDIERDVITR